MAAISTTKFWLFTVALLLLWAIVIATASPASAPASTVGAPHSPTKANKRSVSRKPWGKSSPEEQRNERNCKSSCAQCGLLGFYCGEECLCEYRKTNKRNNNTTSSKPKSNNSSRIATHSDSECLSVMQRRAREQRLPFEILIQGPSSNRFVRTAMQFEQDKARAQAAAASNRNKRSTIMIYKPYGPNVNRLLRPAEGTKDVKQFAATRQRRSVGQLDWFSDLANTLVRPAPLRAGADSSSSSAGGKSAKKRETARGAGRKRVKERSADKSQSWFTDSANLLLRPAPLSRQQNKHAVASSQESDEEIESYDSGASVGHTLKNTIRNIQDSELGENLRSRLRDGADILQDSFGSGNFELFPKTLRDHFSETMDGWRKMKNEGDAPLLTPTAAPRTAQPFLIPWFRPVRFLQRVQQAIN